LAKVTGFIKPMHRAIFMDYNDQIAISVNADVKITIFEAEVLIQKKCIKK